MALLVRRRSPAATQRGPVWNCGVIDPPNGPFGDPLTQPSAAGLGQPLRRMLGQPVLAAREEVAIPEPGTTEPARIDAGFADPAFALLLDPLTRAREAVIARTERLRGLTIRQSLMLPFATLVALLVLIVWLEGGG